MIINRLTSMESTAEQKTYIGKKNINMIMMSVICIVLFTFPLFFNSYVLSVMILIYIAVIGAVGLNILTGYTGEISLGQGAFLAIGAYSAAILGNLLGIPFWIILPLSGVTASLFGSIVAIPALRLRGLYLAMATFSFQMLIEYIIRNWSLTGKSNGIAAPVASLGPFEFIGEERFYYLALVISGIMVFLAWNITRSKIGRAWLAIRDKDLAASALGIPVVFYKIQAYVVSSFFAGIAGGLMAYYYGYIAPDFFTFIVSIQYLSMILIGGLGSIQGSIIGAIFIILIPEALRLMMNWLPAGASANLLELQQVIYGFIIVVAILFAKKGLAGLWVQFSRKYTLKFSKK